jgi:hypothetical protein
MKSQKPISKPLSIQLKEATIYLIIALLNAHCITQYWGIYLTLRRQRVDTGRSLDSIRSTVKERFSETSNNIENYFEKYHLKAPNYLNRKKIYFQRKFMMTNEPNKLDPLYRKPFKN